MRYGNAALALWLGTALAGCATAPQPPIATVLTERKASVGQKCTIRISIRNDTQVGWDALSILLVARDSSNKPVGNWRALPIGYLDPGATSVIKSETEASAHCAQLKPLSIEFFGYHPVGKPMIIVPNRKVSSALLD